MTIVELFKKIYQVSKLTDTEIYVVGGFVRDEIMDANNLNESEIVLEKSKIRAAIEKDIIEGGAEVVVEEYKKKKDIDFLVAGPASSRCESGLRRASFGVEFAREFDELMEKTGHLIEFPDFDTARYVMEEFEVEFAGARSESYEEKSRKPKVQAVSVEDDLSRRDFTVNAMARQVIKGGVLGELIDPYHGQTDITKKILCTPLEPDKTFSDDPLRILRAARFASQLGFSLEANTYEAMKNNRLRLKIISKERILEEMEKLMNTAKPSIGLMIMYETGLLAEFLPEICALDGVEEIYGQQHKNNLWHTFKVVDNITTLTQKTYLRFSALFHDIGKPKTKKYVPRRGWTFDMHEHLGRKMVKDIGRRLKMANDKIDYIAKLVRWHQQPIQLMDDGVTDSAVRRLMVNLGDDIDDLLKLCRSDITTGNPSKLSKRLRNYDILESRIIEVIEKDKMRAFQSPVRGEEIMEICQLKPGPEVGKMKSLIEEAILDGKIKNNYEEAKELLLRIVKK